MPGQVCVDVSLALMWVLDDPLAEKAEQLWRQWATLETDMIAPPLFRAETTSVIRNKLHRTLISAKEASAALRDALLWPITIWDANDLLQRTAFQMATEYNQPQAYDAQYLAVASLLGCELWTGDKRLFNAVGGALPWVRWIGHYAPQ